MGSTAAAFANTTIEKMIHSSSRHPIMYNEHCQLQVQAGSMQTEYTTTGFFCLIYHIPGNFRGRLFSRFGKKRENKKSRKFCVAKILCPENVVL